MGQSLWMGFNSRRIEVEAKMLNRHGIIAGATGTGKTITLKVMIEKLSDLGVPTFVTDIKGDVSGLGAAGADNAGVNQRVQDFGIDDFEYRGYPVTFWDIYGDRGIPVRTTVASFGPALLARLMELSDTQTSVLTIVFKIAQDRGFELVTLQDLRSVLDWISKRTQEFEGAYGRLSSQTLSTIQRNLVFLDELGAEHFFGQPALNLDDWFRTDASGRGVVNILHSVKLVNQPTLYAMFLIWMLTTLFDTLPEVGDPELPKMVLFFDEARILFKDVPKVLVDRIERVVKLIRSKGVGLFFITQNPTDVSPEVLSQLGNRIQHALRAYTPQEQKAIKATADAFRSNDAFVTKDALMDLGTGEALISFLDEKGKPTVVERAFIVPPHSLMAELDATTHQKATTDNPLNRVYQAVESAPLRLPEDQVQGDKATPKAKEEKPKKPAGRPKKSAFEKTVDSAVTTIGREFGKSLVKSLNNLFKK